MWRRKILLVIYFQAFVCSIHMELYINNLNYVLLPQYPGIKCNTQSMRRLRAHSAMDYEDFFVIYGSEPVIPDAPTFRPLKDPQQNLDLFSLEQDLSTLDLDEQVNDPKAHEAEILRNGQVQESENCSQNHKFFAQDQQDQLSQKVEMDIQKPEIECSRWNQEEHSRQRSFSENLSGKALTILKFLNSAYEVNESRKRSQNQ